MPNGTDIGPHVLSGPGVNVELGAALRTLLVPVSWVSEWAHTSFSTVPRRRGQRAQLLCRLGPMSCTAASQWAEVSPTISRWLHAGDVGGEEVSAVAAPPRAYCSSGALTAITPARCPFNQRQAGC